MARERCVWCGDSSAVRKQRSSQAISVDGDRQCGNCGAAWCPPFPAWLGGLFFIFSAIGLLLCLGAITAALWPASGGDGFPRLRLLLIAPFGMWGLLRSAKKSFRAMTGKEARPTILVLGAEELRQPEA